MATVAAVLSIWPYAVDAQCTAGVADGEVTADGRPVLWKVRHLGDVYPNEIKYYAAGIDHDGDGSPDPYSYMTMGPGMTVDGTNLGQGVNNQGLFLGKNYLYTGNFTSLNKRVLGNCSTVAEVKAVYADTSWMADKARLHYYADAVGAACLWESWDPGGGRVHREYAAAAAARDADWVDYNGDSINDVNMSGWVVRSNKPPHNQTDGGDDMNYDPASAGGPRYYKARNIIAGHVHTNTLTASNLATSFLREDLFEQGGDIQCGVIFHGVRPDEDPRLTTMWSFMGSCETAIAVPVWLHGVESGGANVVPDHQQYNGSADQLNSTAYFACRMENSVNYANLQARTLPFEARHFQIVANELLPSWRARDWSDPDTVEAISAEMKRVQERMDQNVYAFIRYLQMNGVTSTNAPTALIDSADVTGLSVTVAGTGFDDDDLDSADDGEAVTTAWDFGGAGSLAGDTFTYDEAGTYLISFTVTDGEGISQTDWRIVSVPEPATMAFLGVGAALLGVLSRRRRRL
jgi:hypothetical protein